MPYIEQYRRDNDVATSAGELNYLITKTCDNFIGSELSYSKINEVIGVLECAKLEMYRRLAAPYEDKKMSENGDVYRVRA